MCFPVRIPSVERVVASHEGVQTIMSKLSSPSAFLGPIIACKRKTQDAGSSGTQDSRFERQGYEGSSAELPLSRVPNDYRAVRNNPTMSFISLTIGCAMTR